MAMHAMGGNLYTKGSLSIRYGEVSYGSVGSTYVYGFGGGIASRTVDGVSIKSALITGNHAKVGGGIYATSFNPQIPAVIENSTIVANEASRVAAGIFIAAGNTTITNSTIANNDGYIGIYANAPLTMTSTIAFGNPMYDVATAVLAGDHNLIGTSSADVPADTLRSDPKFGPFEHNEGKLSLGLLPGSPAIDAGSNEDNLLYDQRGADNSRTLGLGTDIGSFEVDPDRIFASEFE